MSSALLPPSALPLPLELFLQIIEHIVATPHGAVPIAFPQSDIRTRTLYSLLFVCKPISKAVSSYLYAYCLHLNTPSRVEKIRAQAGPPDSGWLSRLIYGTPQSFEPPPITSLYLCHSIPEWYQYENLRVSTGLLKLVAPTLKRLALFLPVANISQAVRYELTGGALARLTVLEELVSSHSAFFRDPGPDVTLPSLRRLALTGPLHEQELKFLSKCTHLETLVYRRNWFEAWSDPKEIDDVFNAYTGPALRVMLVAEAMHHGPPKGGRTFHEDDPIKFYEVDVPTSYYGDENAEHPLCYEFIREGGVRGTIWQEEARKLEDFATAKKRLERIRAILNQ
ncbi:hypothetical protein BU16DRAFT_308768 [Lophium mytilinum]|uniref:F-box domain-containing protein n=1 Tax=Lophium mytilinum TaxID=390894 RepID=A0A6A6R5Z7_9PEZI|nr:hypothetical protein BU16DRAFT_308768 [Lophium mytilinum]